MIAKLIVHAPDRAAAYTAVSDALGEVRVAGPATNEVLLKAIVDHAAFRAGGFDTGFIAKHLEELAPPPSDTPAEIAALATLAELTRETLKI